MSEPIVIRGYAATFGTRQQPIAAGRPPLVIQAGAFSLAALDARLLFGHNEASGYAGTRNGTLRIWQDATGLAFEADAPPTWAGLSLVNGIARGDYDRCSPLLKSYSTEPGMLDGEEVEFLVRSRVGEISVVTDGADPHSACWLASAPIERLPPHARALATQWFAGRAEMQAARLRVLRAGAKPARSAPAVPASVTAVMGSPLWAWGRQKAWKRA